MCPLAGLDLWTLAASCLLICSVGTPSIGLMSTTAAVSCITLTDLDYSTHLSSVASVLCSQVPMETLQSSMACCRQPTASSSATGTSTAAMPWSTSWHRRRWVLQPAECVADSMPACSRLWCCHGSCAVCLLHLQCPKCLCSMLAAPWYFEGVNCGPDLPCQPGTDPALGILVCTLHPTSHLAMIPRIYQPES